MALQLQALTDLVKEVRLNGETPEASGSSSTAVRVTIPVFKRPARPHLEYGESVPPIECIKILAPQPEPNIALPPLDAEQIRVPCGRYPFDLDPRIRLAFPDIRLVEDPVSHVEPGAEGPAGRWYLVTRGTRVGVFNNWLAFLLY